MNNQTNKSGKLIVISAPSGAGKTTLVEALCAADPKLMVSISHTTRPKRDGEKDKVAYHFTDVDSFRKMVDTEQFLEHAKVFDNYYGTSKTALESQLSKGIDVILEIDWQGAARVRQLMPESISIFILPPSFQALETRLTGRGEDDAGTIQKRMDDAINELSHYKDYDYLVINDEFELALGELQGLIAALRENQRPQQANLSEFVTRLMAKN
ncbi:MAG: guanylate kinase [Gammaproteobacteria bacterium]|nr:guanylate kinase [Gammaproteobacteria bacterium]